MRSVYLATLDFHFFIALQSVYTTQDRSVVDGRNKESNIVVNDDYCIAAWRRGTRESWAKCTWGRQVLRLNHGRVCCGGRGAQVGKYSLIPWEHRCDILFEVYDHHFGWIVLICSHKKINNFIIYNHVLMPPLCSAKYSNGPNGRFINRARQETPKWRCAETNKEENR